MEQAVSLLGKLLSEVIGQDTDGHCGFLSRLISLIVGREGDLNTLVLMAEETIQG